MKNQWVHRLVTGGAAALLISTVLFAQAKERIAYVTAWDAKTHAPVTGLNADAFNVREDDVRREVLRVEPATSPMAIAILVDNTQAASNSISDIRKALTSFIKDVDGLGPIALVGVADRPTILQNYTTDQKQLMNAVGKVFAMPGSGATLLDAIIEVSKGLEKREEDRAALVVLTRENREFSNQHYTQVLEGLAKGGAQMHVVVMTTRAGTSLEDEARNRAQVLDRGPKESGGTYEDVLTSQAFEPKMKELAAVLKSQHKVTYSRPEMLIPPEKFEVKSTKDSIEMSGGQARHQAVR